MSTNGETGKVIGAIGPTSKDAANATGAQGTVVIGKASEGRFFALPAGATTDGTVKSANKILGRLRLRQGQA